VIEEHFRIPRIGKSLTKNQLIENYSIAELIKVLKEYQLICNELKIEKILCAGTAPFRIAKNSSEVIQKVYDETGISINVLTKNQEAFLTFLGGISNFNEYFDKSNFLVIDIGGGSTEMIFGNLHEVNFYKSYDIGALVLKDKFFDRFPFYSELKTVSVYLSEVFTDNFNFNNFITIAVAGTPTTIASIYLNQKIFNERLVDKLKISKIYLDKLIHQFYKLSPEEILTEFPSVVKGREDVILPGTIILKFILNKIGIDEFYVSVRGVRYGIIVSELMNQTDGFWTKVGLKKFLSSL
jgi:exopolyphosphatase/guanosine-5'-triphosphate,3'-diphosphate pyrophosphatase